MAAEGLTISSGRKRRCGHGSLSIRNSTVAKPDLCEISLLRPSGEINSNIAWALSGPESPCWANDDRSRTDQHQSVAILLSGALLLTLYLGTGCRLFLDRRMVMSAKRKIDVRRYRRDSSADRLLIVRG